MCNIVNSFPMQRKMCVLRREHRLFGLVFLCSFFRCCFVETWQPRSQAPYKKQKSSTFFVQLQTHSLHVCVSILYSLRTRTLFSVNAVLIFGYTNNMHQFGNTNLKGIVVLFVILFLDYIHSAFCC